MFVIIILAVIGIPLICWIEWIIGEAIGKSVTKGTGLVIGIILIDEWSESAVALART